MTSDPIARYLSQRTAKINKRARLRAMSSSEVIDTAIRAYQTMGWTFLKISAWPSLICLAAWVFFFRYVFPLYFVTHHAGSESGQLWEAVATTGLAVFVAAPLFFFGASYMCAAVTQLVADFMRGATPSEKAAAARASEILPRLLLLDLREVLVAGSGVFAALGLLLLAGHLGAVTETTDAVAGIVFLLACLGFGVGGLMILWVVTRHALAPAILVLEDLRVGEAAKRSSQLMKPDAFRVGGVGAVWLLYLLMGFLYLFLRGGVGASLHEIGFASAVHHWVASLPFSGLISEAVGLLPQFLVIWMLGPVWAATTTILYFDRRIRLEGYDIDALAEDVWRHQKSHRFEL